VVANCIVEIRVLANRSDFPAVERILRFLESRKRSGCHENDSRL
jgi:hypothetical protein